MAGIELRQRQPIPETPAIHGVPGSDLRTNEHGGYVMIEERLPPSYLYGGSNLAAMLGTDMTVFGGIFNDETAQSARMTNPDEYIFLDTETTGLSTGGGTVAFLVGVGFFEAGIFVLRQYFMRDYDDEPAMLSDLLLELGRFTGIVSFNGRAFDWNLLQSRLIYNRLGRGLKEFIHLDLLHPSRRLWKNKLDSCSLSSLEEHILGESRCDDIPGAFIPSAYFGYLENGIMTDIKRILSHNRNDILSMVALVTRISAMLNDPLASASDEAEMFGLGRTFESGSGYGYTEVVRCFEACIQNGGSYIRDAAVRRLTCIYKRTGDFEKAACHWEEQLSDDTCLNTFPAIELAKYYEHRAKDLTKALGAASKAMEIYLRIGLRNSRELDMLTHRIERINRKIARCR